MLTTALSMLPQAAATQAAAILSAATLLGSPPSDVPAGFEAPFRVTAGGVPIVPSAGHAKPYVTDWNGDGVRDLLVGQFGGGRLRIHLNRSGEDGVWDLDGGRWFYADGRLGTVPFG